MGKGRFLFSHSNAIKARNGRALLSPPPPPPRNLPSASHIQDERTPGEGGGGRKREGMSLISSTFRIGRAYSPLYRSALRQQLSRQLFWVGGTAALSVAFPPSDVAGNAESQLRRRCCVRKKENRSSWFGTEVTRRLWTGGQRKETLVIKALVGGGGGGGRGKVCIFN